MHSIQPPPSSLPSILNAGCTQGHWVVLNNVHLMPRWLPTLDKRLDYYKEIGSNADFRVMLSSDPTNTIPVGILERWRFLA